MEIRENALTPPDPAAWTGRVDGDGPEHARWHQRVRPAAAAATGDAAREPAPPSQEHPSRADVQDHVSLLGFRSDEGVRRNGGRVGAAEGPAALRTALGPLALHGPLAEGSVGLLDHGDALTPGEDLEGGQEAAAQLISRALDADGNRLTVVLGGGHETAWASYFGLMRSGLMAEDADPPLRWGVLNLDAHFDLRLADVPTSGTPFLQMAEAEAAAGRSLEYCVLGISEPSNTGALFATAERLGVTWYSDHDVTEMGAAGIRRVIADFAAELDVLYLTIDLDVMPAADAPGVSAPAAIGVAPALIAAAVRAAAGTGKLALLDVVELNPQLDIDRRTARTAARLIDEAVRAAITAD